MNKIDKTQFKMRCPIGSETFPLGFGLFQVDSGNYSIQKLDDVEEIEDSYDIKVQRTYESDGEAAKMVQVLANNGNDVCRRVIDFLIRSNSPDVLEFNLIRTW